MGAERTTLRVAPEVRDRVQTLKYKLGHSSADETVRHLLEEAKND